MQHLINLYYGLDKHYNCQNRKILSLVLVFLPWLEEEYLLLTPYYVMYYVIDFITRRRVQTYGFSCIFMVFIIVIWAFPLYKAVIPSFCETFLTTSKIPFQSGHHKVSKNFFCYFFGISRSVISVIVNLETPLLTWKHDYILGNITINLETPL